MTTFSNFTYYNPTRIVFGSGTIASIEKLIHTDKKILFIYGGGSIKTNGVYAQVTEALKGHTFTEFSGVEANPHKETLDKAVAVVKNEGIDFILAVGGGSVIDGAKYVAAAALYDGDGWDILEWKHTVKKAVPIGAVLTLPATGSESNGGSVITRAETQEKRFFKSEAVYPVFAVMDYTVMTTLSDRQLANGLVDTFVHTAEQYLTYPTDGMVQDGYAEALLRNIAALAKDWENRRTESWQKNLMWTSNQALNELIGVGVPQDWATHMIGHELTAIYGLDHGQTLAIVLPALLRQLRLQKSKKLLKMGRNVFGLEGADLTEDKTIDKIEALFRSVDVKLTLSEYGIKADVDAVVTALKGHGMTALGETGSITPDVAACILQRAL
ncbi:iron-containing alcohol dehydrogenase [Seleniivibrio woodruffii]|uniref:NADP-dependent alcohol dehydrogenase n=1 Tax=Seleniivibrio woodruffii TaxID=1078050 RepID=A0A4R1K5F1_9BACT|nr:iron-containing alcohol dehydrogenase [Seleniivibrio woodruffii]TCK59374.1 NADP-dependent alcohol dehydrogenase [Seleniivibrio woodruffii]TVZ35587.1 NADP-dependent alcohol dehydrogenase [Seleniivibrio woodruffii]